MMNSHTGFVAVNGKNYSYTITVLNKDECRFVCEGARMDQEWQNEDIPMLLADLPNLILDEIEFQRELKAKESKIYCRVSPQEKFQIKKNAISMGFPSVSAFLRHRALSV